MRGFLDGNKGSIFRIRRNIDYVGAAQFLFFFIIQPLSKLRFHPRFVELLKLFRNITEGILLASTL